MRLARGRCVARHEARSAGASIAAGSLAVAGRDDGDGTRRNARQVRVRARFVRSARMTEKPAADGLWRGLERRWHAARNGGGHGSTPALETSFAHSPRLFLVRYFRPCLGAGGRTRRGAARMALAQPDGRTLFRIIPGLRCLSEAEPTQIALDSLDSGDPNWRRMRPARSARCRRPG
jgi:hypothetical protein